jgi:hypothetical protein
MRVVQTGEFCYYLGTVCYEEFPHEFSGEFMHTFGTTEWLRVVCHD